MTTRTYTLRDLPHAHRGGTAYALHRAATRSATPKQLLRMIADTVDWLATYQPGIEAQAARDLRITSDLLTALADNLHDRMRQLRTAERQQAARYARDLRATGRRTLAQAVITTAQRAHPRRPA